MRFVLGDTAVRLGAEGAFVATVHQPVVDLLQCLEVGLEKLGGQCRCHYVSGVDEREYLLEFKSALRRRKHLGIACIPIDHDMLSVVVILHRPEWHGLGSMPRAREINQRGFEPRRWRASYRFAGARGSAARARCPSKRPRPGSPGRGSDKVSQSVSG